MLEEWKFSAFFPLNIKLLQIYIQMSGTNFLDFVFLRSKPRLAIRHLRQTVRQNALDTSQHETVREESGREAEDSACTREDGVCYLEVW